MRKGCGFCALFTIAGATFLSCQYGTRPTPSATPRPPPMATIAAPRPLPTAGPAAGPVVAAPTLPPSAPVQKVAQAPIAVPHFGGPVPMGRGDAQRTGRSPFHLPQKPPTEVWRFEAQGAIIAAPTVASDGTVLFTSHDRYVYALLSDGSLRWKQRTGDFVWSAAALSADGRVFVGSDDDKLYALNLMDSTQGWAVAPGSCRWAVGRGPEASRCDIEDVTLGPDGTIYVGGDGIYAVQPDGKTRWSFSPEPERERKRHCSSAPALGLDGSVYAVCTDRLYALNPDGTKRWHFEAQGEFDSGPVLGPDGTLYLGDEARRFVAVDAQGQLRFSFITGGPVRAPAALRSDGMVLFGAYDGLFYAVRPDGTLAWSFATADSIHSAPLIDADGAVAFGSRDNHLYALSADGKLRWSVTFDNDVDGAPTLGPDGTLYIGGDDKTLHALR